MGQIGFKMNQKRARNSVIVPKKPFLAEILIAEHTLSEEIILNEVRKSGKKLFSASGVLLTRKNT